jgi:hypothetical protein
MSDSGRIARLVALMAANGYSADKIMEYASTMEPHGSLILAWLLFISFLGMTFAYLSLHESDPRTPTKIFERLSTFSVALVMGLPRRHVAGSRPILDNIVVPIVIVILLVWLVWWNLIHWRRSKAQ